MINNTMSTLSNEDLRAVKMAVLNVKPKIDDSFKTTKHVNSHFNFLEIYAKFSLFQILCQL